MRTSGVLMPIFSLASDYGIGTLGKEAYNFVDFLNKAGQTYWQILPVGVTSFGDSPYQSFSSYAGNPYFIDLDLLTEDGLLKKEEVTALDWGKDSSKVDYELMYQNRYKILKTAFLRFKEDIPKDFYEFQKENELWLENFALFCALKDYHKGASFDYWEDDFKFKKAEAMERIETELSDSILFYKTIQYFFFKQWKEPKEYANNKGIYIIGDIPIYVAYDSADVWSAPQGFLLSLI